MGGSRRTLHRWLARYEADGLEGLPDRSHRPERCPHQMPAEVEVLVLELRRAHRYWGARRLALELARKRVTPAPSKSSVYRCLVRAGLIESDKRHRRKPSRRIPTRRTLRTRSRYGLTTRVGLDHFAVIRLAVAVRLQNGVEVLRQAIRRDLDAHHGP